MNKSKLLILASFFSIYVIWGSTYLLNKIAVAEIPPLFLASIRFGIAGILILIIAKLLKKSLKISKRELLNVTIAGFLVFVWALKYVDSGFAALIASTQPLFVLFLLRLIDGKKMQRKSIIGVCLGILGMYLLVSQKSITTSEGMVIGIFMILSCVLSWSYGSVFVSKASLPQNFFVSTGYQMVIASILQLIASQMFNEDISTIKTISFQVQLSIIILIIFGSIVAFTAFNYLLKVVSPEKVSTSAYVNPVIALILGWYFLDEKLTSQSIVASVVLLTGVYFITSRKRIAKNKIRPSQKT
jgi:drug/metabolite transporter (DMT)-like permease